MPSASFANLKVGLKSVDNVLSFAKTGVGKPSMKEQSLFVASVALSYAVWENFAEDLAVEAVVYLAHKIDPDKLLPEPQKFIERDASAWQLAVHPGWRDLWVKKVTDRAKGDPDQDRSFGLLTANVGNLRKIFATVGVDPFDGLSKDKLDALDDLVALRGSIVHTGNAPAGFQKSDAVNGKTLVQEIADHSDKKASDQVKALVGSKPW